MQNIDKFLDEQKYRLQIEAFERNAGKDLIKGLHGKLYLPFTMENVRKLPIVGDVHYGREQWPSTQKDWSNLLSIAPLPVKLNKIVYSVNEKEAAFSSLGLRFASQTFESQILEATDHLDNLVCHVKI